MILSFEPNIHKAIWGEENWLVSAHRSSPSVPVASLQEEMPGTLADFSPSFPILVKTIHARERLSVQVHPNDRTSRVIGGEPKTEMWFALRDGFAYAGFKDSVTPDDLKKAVAEGTVENLLCRLPLKAGDILYLPGGLVHSVGDNTDVYEVQQSSDTTFRLYDWGRKGPDGKARQLHLAEALASIDYSLPPPKPVSSVSCEFFNFRRVAFTGRQEIAPSPVVILYVFRGEVTLRGETLTLGASRLALGETAPLELFSSAGAEVLVTTKT